MTPPNRQYLTLIIFRIFPRDFPAHLHFEVSRSGQVVWLSPAAVLAHFVLNRSDKFYVHPSVSRNPPQLGEYVDSLFPSPCRRYSGSTTTS